MYYSREITNETCFPKPTLEGVTFSKFNDSVNFLLFYLFFEWCITDAIFIVRQLQEKYLGEKKDLWIAFVDLEKAFDRVPREVVWWALKSLGVDDWIVSVIKAMYEDATTRVKLNGRESRGLV